MRFGIFILFILLSGMGPLVPSLQAAEASWNPSLIVEKRWGSSPHNSKQLLPRIKKIQRAEIEKDWKLQVSLIQLLIDLFESDTIAGLEAYDLSNLIRAKFRNTLLDQKRVVPWLKSEILSRISKKRSTSETGGRLVSLFIRARLQNPAPLESLLKELNQSQEFLGTYRPRIEVVYRMMDSQLVSRRPELQRFLAELVTEKGRVGRSARAQFTSEVSLDSSVAEFLISKIFELEENRLRLGKRRAGQIQSFKEVAEKQSNYLMTLDQPQLLHPEKISSNSRDKLGVFLDQKLSQARSDEIKARYIRLVGKFRLDQKPILSHLKETAKTTRLKPLPPRYDGDINNRTLLGDVFWSLAAIGSSESLKIILSEAPHFLMWWKKINLREQLAFLKTFYRSANFEEISVASKGAGALLAHLLTYTAASTDHSKGRAQLMLRLYGESDLSLVQTNVLARVVNRGDFSTLESLLKSESAQGKAKLFKALGHYLEESHDSQLSKRMNRLFSAT